MNYLGLDVGGSKCRYEWWPAGVAAGGDGDPVQPAADGVDRAVAGLAEVLAKAARAGEPDAVVCALAGVGDPAVRTAIQDGLRRCIDYPVAVVGDVLAAAAAGLRDGPGVLIWSGTGSFAIARGVGGELERVGGRGYLLGDQGSGFDLVRRAAAAVLMAADDLGPSTALTEALTSAFGASAPERLGAAVQALSPGEVASHLPLVLTVAAAGDAVANDVITAGVDGLAMLVVAAARQVDLDTRHVAVACGGGVLSDALPIREALAERLQILGTGELQPVGPHAAAHAAAWLAHGWHQGEQPQQQWVERVAL